MSGDYLDPRERVNFLELTSAYGRLAPDKDAEDYGVGFMLGHEYYSGLRGGPKRPVCLYWDWTKAEVYVMSPEPLVGAGTYQYKGLTRDSFYTYYFVEREAPNPKMKGTILKYIIEWNAEEGHGYMYEEKHWKRMRL